MNQTKTAQQVAAYIRAHVKMDIGKIETVGRKISEDYHWTTKAGWRHAWRYKYYVLADDKANMDRAYEAYKLINSMSNRIQLMFGYKVKCRFTNYYAGNPNSTATSLIYNVTPCK